MLRILPLASSFHPRDQVHQTVARIARDLETRRIPGEILTSGRPNALLVVTGGTEHLALQALQGGEGPALLLAHPDQNSLPAALEILCRLQQTGRRGRIVLLNGAEAGLAELAELARHLDVRERLKATRLGRIGAPSDWLVGSMQEPELLQRAWGPAVVDVPLTELRAAMDGAQSSDVAALGEDFRSRACAVREPSAGDLALAARVAVGLRRVLHDHRLDACTLRCFDLVLDLKTTGCLALSSLLDQGVVAGCEGDLPAAMTMLWMQTLSGQTSFMANPQDLDRSDNTLWLAHCTIARKLLENYTLRSHFESSLGVGLQGEVAPGPFTLARIGGADLRDLFVSDGALLANGASERRCRTQVQLRLEEDVTQLLARPLGNHHVLLPGRWAQELRAYHALFVAK